MYEFSLDELYTIFRREIEKRKLRGPTLERDGFYEDENIEEEWITYTYTPASDDGLDFMLAITSTASYELMIGPVVISVDMTAVERTAKEWAVQLADIAQMILNGQFAVVLTERDEDDAWQAAELVWTDEHGQRVTTVTLSNHERSGDALHACLLKNSATYPLVHLLPTHTAHPPKVNNHYLLARAIDFDNVTPLTKKEFNVIQNMQPVQLIGGEADKPIWSVFYRRIEFWVIAVIVLTLYIVITERWFGEDSWINALVRMVFGAIGMAIIVYGSIIMLVRRQATLDAGKRPLGEAVEGLLFSRGAVATVVMAMALTAYFAPIWTPHHDIHHLYTALQLSHLLIVPITVSIVLYSVALLVVPRTSKRNKIVRALLFAAGFSGLLYANMVICNGSEEAASADWWWILIIAGLPIAITAWLIIDIFMPISRKRQTLEST